MTSPLLTFSIVSHGQSDLIYSLLKDLKGLALPNIEIILTINIPEDESFYLESELPLKIYRNKKPKGFGANHNTAFNSSRGKFFVILNPDIRFTELNVNKLLATMNKPNVGAVAPVVLNSSGDIEDSARCFPTISRLIRRILLRQRNSDYIWASSPIEVDWTAGMFIVFKREAFISVGGFDEFRFFMYFEDVDICDRLWRTGWAVLLEPNVTVIHNAQRASRRSAKHFYWHLISAIRYLAKI